MTLEELAGYLRMLAVRAGEAAIPGADAMGRVYRDEVKRELTRLSHARGTVTPSPPGAPPAMESGALAGSVTMVPASTPVVATASVSPHTIYDAVQEYGHTMHAHHDFMHYFYGGERFSRTVTVPPRPYMRPAIDIVAGNGSCAAAAAAAFYAALWG